MIPRDNLCLNVGCWTDVAEEWINVDASVYVKISKIPMVGSLILSTLKAPRFPPSIYCGDVVKGLNIKQNSCQLIFVSHVLEHLSLTDFYLALKNLYSYLRKDGIIRIIVPDLESYINDYLKQKSNPNTTTQAAYKLMKNSYLGYQPSRRTLYHRWREILANSRHQWMWDEASLTAALREQGFKNIKKHEYGHWSDPRFQLVEKKERHYQAICLEATK
jgi:hypothetical protein